MRGIQFPWRIGAVTSLLLSACVTPPELKEASKAQLELIDTMDRAVVELRKSLDEFHRDRAALILSAARVELARQAIDLVVEAHGDGPMSADELFRISNDDVRRWVDSSARRADLGHRRDVLEGRITAHQAAADQADDDASRQRALALLNSVRNDLDDLDRLEGEIGRPPPEFAELESQLRENLNNERNHRQAMAEHFTLWRSQIAVMQTMATTVDSWLTIDVTVTQEQADSLRDVIKQAIASQEGE